MLVFSLALGVLAGASWVQLGETLLGTRERFIVLGIMLGCMLLWWCVGRALAAGVGRYLTRITLIFSVAGLGMVLWSTLLAERELAKRLPEALDQQSVWLDVVVADLPTRHERGWRFEVKVLAARWSADSAENISDFPVQGVMSWYLHPPKDARDGKDSREAADAEQTINDFRLAPGQRWQFKAKVRRAAGTLNPGGFDLEAWMLEKKLYFSGTVALGKKDPPPHQLGGVSSLQIRIDQMRDRLRQSIDQRLPDSAAKPVISALVVGDQRAISTADWALFQRTGVSHLMSISGLHVTMLAALAGALGTLLWRALCCWPISAGLWLPVQSVSAVFACVGAFGYALLAGFAIPAQRTAWMVGVVCLCRWCGIRADPWAVIAIALIVVLVMDPMACLAPGFWLSFFAVAVLFGLAQQDDLKRDDPVHKRRDSRERKAGGDFKARKEDRDIPALRQTFSLMRLVCLAAHAQFAITFGLLPMTVLLFQQIVVVGPLANAVAIPVVSYLVTPLAMLASLVALGSDWPGLFQAAAWVYTVLYGFLNWCAGLPWALFDWPSPGVLRATLASVGVAVALSGFMGQRFGRWRHLGWLSLMLLWGPVAEPAPPHGQMAVTFIDVGQGSGVLIQTESHAMLVDTGPLLGGSDAGARMVLPTLRRHGVRRLDQLMISHFDQDHSGGLLSILAALKVDMLSSPEDEPTARARVESPETKRQQVGMTFSQCQAGQHWEWDGVKFWVLFPARGTDTVPISEQDRNSRSCVLRVVAADGSSVLLAGDLPAKGERALVAQFAAPSDSADRGLPHLDGAALASQVLLAPHHGSKTSSSQALLDAVRPQWVVIQAGYRNRFGHPHAEVLARLTVPVLRTDLLGAVHFRWPDPGGPPVVTDFWAAHRRYWHIARAASG